MPENGLRVYHLAVVDENILGPGRRVAVWTAGCPFHCAGCIEVPLQSFHAGKLVETGELLERIAPHLRVLRAITFSGGEPLAQPDPMIEILEELRHGEVDVMLYTGMSSRRFLRDYRKFHPYIDLCVTEPFLKRLHGDHLWRGSSNQRLLSPSGKYTARQLAAWRQAPGSGVQLHLDDRFCHTYGIPAPGILEALHRNLTSQGIRLDPLY